ncbi:MAG: hypothetical protein IPL54_14635 [Chitinophagaceae bacterium]|nr:hypothetical protein [Chitinophagaceae bacterium]
MKRCFIFLSAVMLCTNIYAQHCPYDGTYLIAIKVVDEKGNLPTNVNTVFYLQEVDNPMADSCTSGAGLVKTQFLNSDDFIAEMDRKFNRNGYSKGLNNRLNDAGVFANANMMLTLNHAENTCTLIGKSETVYTNYIYRQRKFVIAYTVNGTEIRHPLPDGYISALCTNNRDLKSFKTVTIRL